jgi:pantoate--beta-alanine ligase
LVRNAEAIRRQVREVIQAEPLARIEYVSVADDETLEELTALGGPALVSLAVRFGRTRLIDNVTLG